MLLTAEQAAERLTVSMAALAKWRLNGKGPKWIRIGHGTRGPVRYSSEALDEWLESRTRHGHDTKAQEDICSGD